MLHVRYNSATLPKCKPFSFRLMTRDTYVPSWKANISVPTDAVGSSRQRDNRNLSQALQPESVLVDCRRISFIAGNFNIYRVLFYIPEATTRCRHDGGVFVGNLRESNLGIWTQQQGRAPTK